MKKELSKTYDPSSFEDRLYEHWLTSGYFKPDPDENKPAFSVVIPPPNVTGQLHMGHALDETLQDITSLATPFAFLILGGDLKLNNMLRDVKATLFSVIGKIMVIPAIMLPVSALLGFNQLEMAIVLAIFATPNAVSSYAMARNYKADYELAGEIVTLSTLLSILTIFIYVTVCKSFGWI